MTLLDATTTVRDLQMELMRQKGGVLVGADEINGLLAHLDESFLLDSERYRNAKNGIITDFTSKRITPCFHCGKGAGITTGIAEKGIVWDLSGGCPSPAVCIWM